MKISATKYLAVAAVQFVLTLSPQAALVSPTGYIFDQPTSTGTWGYHDPNFTKLTDGIYGTAPWSLNQGGEWDGWYGKRVVNIDFSFNGIKNINKITVGTVQDNIWDVAMPDVAVYSSSDGGFTWFFVDAVLIPLSSANDNQYRSIVFNNLSVSANAMRIALGEEGPWTFTDEITFEGATAVPEPSTYIAGLSALGMLGLFGWRSRK